MLKLAKKLGWPGALLGVLVGGSVGTYEMIVPDSDYMVLLQVVESHESRLARQEHEKAVKDFCGYLDGMSNQTLAAELRAELGLCK